MVDQTLDAPRFLVELSVAAGDPDGQHRERNDHGHDHHHDQNLDQRETFVAHGAAPARRRVVTSDRASTC